jgi:hypothetical protein
MNISKALKEKNKKVKSINELLKRLANNNSIIFGNTRSYDPKILLDQIKEQIDSLVELKTKIHEANSTVYNKIFRMSELKSFVSQIKKIDTGEGKQKATRYSDEYVERTACFKESEINKIVEAIENEIEDIQEELDNHNHKTEI